MNLLTHLFGAARERNRLQHRLQPFALAFLHLLQLIGIREIRRRLAGQILRALEALLQPTGAVLKRTAHGVGARREPALVQRHQEADCPGAWVFALGSRTGALALHETRYVAVEIELGASIWKSTVRGMRLVKIGSAAHEPSARRSGKWTIASLVRRR